MKLATLNRGTHMVRLAEINNDIPSPAEVMAETLADLEYHLAALISDGGADTEKLAHVQYRVSMLFESLKSATEQGWKFTLAPDQEQLSAACRAGRAEYEEAEQRRPMLPAVTKAINALVRGNA